LKARKNVRIEFGHGGGGCWPGRRIPRAESNFGPLTRKNPSVSGSATTWPDGVLTSAARWSRG
jgi:hypothetical protein